MFDDLPAGRRVLRRAGRSRGLNFGGHWSIIADKEVGTCVVLAPLLQEEAPPLSSHARKNAGYRKNLFRKSGETRKGGEHERSATEIPPPVDTLATARRRPLGASGGSTAASRTALIHPVFLCRLVPTSITGSSLASGTTSLKNLSLCAHERKAASSCLGGLLKPEPESRGCGRRDNTAKVVGVRLSYPTPRNQCLPGGFPSFLRTTGYDSSSSLPRSFSSLRRSQLRHGDESRIIRQRSRLPCMGIPSDISKATPW